MIYPLSAWEGLEAKQWTDTQLTAIQAFMSKRDVAEEMREAMRTEIIFSNEIYTSMAAGDLASAMGTSKALTPLIIPFIDHNNAETLEFYHGDILQSSQNPDGYIQAMDQTEATITALSAKSSYNPRYILTRMTIPSMGRFIEKSARSHAELGMAAAACALERYFLANQTYPEKLEALVPDFAKLIPIDPVSGNPLHYEKTKNGRYELYSIGADGDDNWGGEGDITWNYTTPPPLPPKTKPRSKRRRSAAQQAE